MQMKWIDVRREFERGITPSHILLLFKKRMMGGVSN
jgi:hypothetical protein